MNGLARVRLDHARPSRGRLPGPTMLLAAAAVLCTGAALYAVQLAGTATSLQEQVQVRRAVPRAAALRRAHAPADPIFLARERQTAQVRAELGLPWEALFRAIEGAASADVSLLVLSPTAARARLNLGGEARNMGALLQFLKRLQANGAYSSVYLREHHVDLANAQQPVRFSMELTWSGAHE